MEPRNPTKKTGEVTEKKEIPKSVPLVKTQDPQKKIMNPHRSRNPSLRPSTGSNKRPGSASRRPIQQLAEVTRRPVARQPTQVRGEGACLDTWDKLSDGNDTVLIPQRARILLHRGGYDRGSNKDIIGINCSAIKHKRQS